MSSVRYVVIGLACGLMATAAAAQTASTTTIHANLPGDGAVKADPKPKPSPVGQKATDYHPSVKTTPAKPPPSPVVTPKKN